MRLNLTKVLLVAIDMVRQNIMVGVRRGKEFGLKEDIGRNLSR